MPDEMDYAVEKADKLHEFKLMEARQRANTREIEPTGNCHWCEEPTVEGRLFCNKDCSDDWDRSRRSYKK